MRKRTFPAHVLSTLWKYVGLCETLRKETRGVCIIALASFPGLCYSQIQCLLHMTRSIYVYLFTSLIPRLLVGREPGYEATYYKLEAEYDKGQGVVPPTLSFIPSVFVLQLPVFDSCLIDDTTVIVWYWYCNMQQHTATLTECIWKTRLLPTLLLQSVWVRESSLHS